MVGRTPVAARVPGESGATAPKDNRKRGSRRGDSAPVNADLCDPAEPPTVTVHVQMHFQRRGGRKVVLTSQCQGSVIDQRSTNARADPLLAAFARAFYWRKLIDTGVCSSITEIAATEGVSAAYISRMMRLTLLKPETLLRLLRDRTGGGGVPTLAELTQPNSVAWQR